MRHIVHDEIVGRIVNTCSGNQRKNTGDEVKAVYKCKVAEVSSNSELGNYVKLDLGNGYVVTLGQSEDIKVALGEYLEAGDVVGTIGEPSRFYTKEGTNLYFAIEKDGNPVDPMLLIQ